MKLQAFHYRTRPLGGEDGRNILVWGRLQDIQARQTTMIEHCTKTGAMKVPVVCDGLIAWVNPARITLLEDAGAQPPEAWVKTYQEGIGA